MREIILEAASVDLTGDPEQIEASAREVTRRNFSGRGADRSAGYAAPASEAASITGVAL